jgi:predicted secreted protein
MRVRVNNIFSIALLLALVGYCMNSTLKMKNPSDVVVNISKNDADNSIYQVSVNTAQKLLVKIQGNITTGYEWYLDNYSSIDTNVLRPLNLNSNGTTRSYYSEDSGRFGEGGTYHFYFQPISPGQPVVLKFINKQAWSNLLYKTASVIVNITG